MLEPEPSKPYFTRSDLKSSAVLAGHTALSYHKKMCCPENCMEFRCDRHVSCKDQKPAGWYL